MSYFPTSYQPATSDQSDSGDRKSRYFEPRKLKDGESATFRLCGTHETGHVICGYSYFTAAGAPKRSPSFPANYLNDIGLSYEGKVNNTGEKDTPKFFLSVTALHKETDEFVVLTIMQRKIREQLEEILAMEDYQFIDGEVANFFLTLRRKGGGIETSYTLMPTLKAPSAAECKRWSAEAAGIWLPALYSGADPFAGRPAGSNTAVGLPPTYRDQLGADHEVATATNADAMPSGW